MATSTSVSATVTSMECPVFVYDVHPRCPPVRSVDCEQQMHLIEWGVWTYGDYDMPVEEDVY